MSDAAKIVISLAIPPAIVAVVAYAPWVVAVFVGLVLWLGASALIINIWAAEEWDQ